MTTGVFWFWKDNELSGSVTHGKFQKRLQSFALFNIKDQIMGFFCKSEFIK